jgi:hypothetical protein
MRKLVIYICFALILAAFVAKADDLQPIAVVEIACKNSRGPSPEEESMALKNVRVQLMAKYLTSLGAERKKLLEPKFNAISQDAQGFLQNLVIRTKEFDKKTKFLTLSAQADVDVSKINSLIDVDGQGEKNPIVFVFVARRQAEVETKGPKVTTGTQRIESAQKEVSSQSRAGETSTAVGSKTSEAVTTVNSVTKTADRIVYQLEDNAKAAIDRTITQGLVDRGFDTVSAADLVDATKGLFNPDKLQKDFETSSQFSLDNQRLAIKACREAGAPLLAYGTLTIGIQRPDPVNAKNVIVNVIVDAQILDCRKPLTIKAASIGALQVEGVGADQTQAELAGLNLAAAKAAQILADQLRSRGIR